MAAMLHISFNLSFLYIVEFNTPLSFTVSIIIVLNPKTFGLTISILHRDVVIEATVTPRGLKPGWNLYSQAGHPPKILLRVKSLQVSGLQCVSFLEEFYTLRDFPLSFVS